MVAYLNEPINGLLYIYVADFGFSFFLVGVSEELEVIFIIHLGSRINFSEWTFDYLYHSKIHLIREIP